jgi:hypothetical protein
VPGAVTRALRREAHVLSGLPGLLWQQFYNRLQWIASAEGMLKLWDAPS